MNEKYKTYDTFLYINKLGFPENPIHFINQLFLWRNLIGVDFRHELDEMSENEELDRFFVILNISLRKCNVGMINKVTTS